MKILVACEESQRSCIEANVQSEQAALLRSQIKEGV